MAIEEKRIVCNFDYWNEQANLIAFIIRHESNAEWRDRAFQRYLSAIARGGSLRDNEAHANRLAEALKP